MEGKTLSEFCDPFANMPDAEEWKAFSNARQRAEQAIYVVGSCPSLEDRDLTAHALQVLASACDELRSCARTLANKQTTLLQQEVAKPKPEW